MSQVQQLPPLFIEGNCVLLQGETKPEPARGRVKFRQSPLPQEAQVLAYQNLGMQLESGH